MMILVNILKKKLMVKTTHYYHYYYYYYYYYKKILDGQNSNFNNMMLVSINNYVHFIASYLLSRAPILDPPHLK